MFCFASIYSQPIQNNFINALVNKSSSLQNFIDKGELARSERLGIKYSDVSYKWLISFDIPEDFKAGFRKGIYNYSLQTLNLDSGFSVVTLAVSSMNYLQKFYFLREKFISPSRYLTRNWEASESRYFKFRISEPKYFNSYCIKQLDDFVDSLCGMLKIGPDMKLLLEREKIYYTFCRDENEVEKLTGFKSKGMSVLAFDEIITAYQTHFHEVAHILMNFKLRSLGSYTLPFLMEGFAVAIGGRGGLAARVVTNVGYFLQKAGYLTYDSILTYDSFSGQDANMTYSISGLYNSFLLSSLGIERYLDLYKSVNGDFNFVSGLKPEKFSLPDAGDFNEFLKRYYENRDVVLNNVDSYDFEFDAEKINYEDKDSYFNFLVSDKYSLIKDSGSAVEPEYSSKMFEDITGKKYNNEKYLICTDTNYIKVYNCYDNLLIASYDKEFSIDQRRVSTAFRVRTDVYPIQTVARYFVFNLKKSLFDTPSQFVDVMKLNN